VASACETGVIHTFLQPAYKAFPMVAAKDVGRAAADLIQEGKTGVRVVELEGPCRVSPNDLADVIAAISGHTSLREVERYTRAADQEWMARIGMAALIKGRDVG
jgi:uncharacterized protein YbjT (DUF2867 family)